MQTINDKLQAQKEILEEMGYSVAYLALYGSQNYNLHIHTDDYQSDVDMKAIIVPTLDDLIMNSKPVSLTVETEWGECDVKDIRLYFKTLLKANPAYVETLYTDYYVVDPKFTEEFKQVFNLKDELIYTLRAQMIRAMFGMMLEKKKAMCHPYPSIAHKIEKFGYDGKQLSHSNRLLVMMEDYFTFGGSLKVSLKPENSPLNELTGTDIRKEILDYKLNKPSLEEAEEAMHTIIGSGKQLRDEVLESIDEKTIDYSIKDEFLALSQQIIKNKIVEELRG